MCGLPTRKTAFQIHRASSPDSLDGHDSLPGKHAIDGAVKGAVDVDPIVVFGFPQVFRVWRRGIFFEGRISLSA